MIYLDNAATTKVKAEVREAMNPYLNEIYANPASAYTFAGNTNKEVEKARESAANLIGAKSAEIYFTAGGSEADNWAVKGAALANIKKGKHIITSQIEHHAVLKSCEFLEKLGFEITYLPVDSEGFVSPAELEAAIRPDTTLISIMFANNEIGTVEPVKEIGGIAKKHGIIFHTDAVQAAGHIKIDVNDMNIDMLSVSAHKFGGPKGVGFLYIRKGVKIESLIHGGNQERGRRAGTANTPGIIGLGKAAEIALRDMEKNAEKEKTLRDHLISRIENEIPFARLNGARDKRLPGNVNFCFRFIEGESLLMLLDMYEICASSGSACTSGSLDPSHVLLAIGLPHEIAHGSLRLTLSEENTAEEIDFTVDKLKEIVEKLRAMSPLYEDYLKGKKTEASCAPGYCARAAV